MRAVAGTLFERQGGSNQPASSHSIRWRGSKAGSQSRAAARCQYRGWRVGGFPNPAHSVQASDAANACCDVFTMQAFDFSSGRCNCYRL